MNEHFYNGFIKRAQDYGFDNYTAFQLFKMAEAAVPLPRRTPQPLNELVELMPSVRRSAAPKPRVLETPTAPTSPVIEKPEVISPEIRSPVISSKIKQKFSNSKNRVNKTPWTSTPPETYPTIVSPMEKKNITNKLNAWNVKKY
jgi:hypothetical protein